MGEDLFIKGSAAYPHTSYSPDGLAVIDLTNRSVTEVETIVDGVLSITGVVDETVTTEIVLVEFKCPYSRLPNGTPPKYYIPQVKMGLQLLELPTTGLYIEGVFRRCAWADLGNNPICDTTLVPKKIGDMPKSFGVIGFYASVGTYAHPFVQAYIDNYIEFGDKSNGFMSNDLGDCSPELFTLIMDAYDKKIILPWYGSVVTGGDQHLTDLITFTKFCENNNYTAVGILPWKLFHIDYHMIKKESGYINKWLPKIAEVINIVHECLKLDMVPRARRYSEYLAAAVNDNFI